MMQKHKIISLAAILALTGCQSIKNLSSRDDSYTSATNSKSGKLRFLDNIAISPEDKKSSRYTYSNLSDHNTPSSGAYLLSNTAIERANFLQIKYSIILNVTVEQLNNVPLLKQIEKWWGTRYCMGGSTENCIDCSAFTQAILLDVYSIWMPRTAREQFSTTERIKRNDLMEGDLVFFKSGRHISHVGIFLTNEKFVHASSSNGVIISDLNDSYWKSRYAGAGRSIVENESSSRKLSR